MKRTFHISIAKTLFILEEDAYAKLDAYLTSVREHFGDTPARDEIVADIEARIAEQLLESHESVITLNTIERVIGQMGRVEDFEDGDNTGTAPKAKKRLYRDTDNKIIAGVCAGIAELFNINVLWVRIVFVVLALSNAVGIILYIVLWLILPEAKTVSQKLEMEGSPVTLETLSAAVQDGAHTVQKSGSKVVQALRNIVSSIGRIARILVGSILILGAGAAMAGVTLGSGFIMSNTAWIADDIPLSSLLPGAQYWIVLTAMMLSVILVLLCIILAGFSIIRRKKIIEPWIGFGIFGIWLITLVISGYGIAKIVSNYHNTVAVSPAYQTVTRDIVYTDPINTLVVEDHMRITVVESAATTSILTVAGRQKNVEGYEAENVNGTLTISRQRSAPRQFCFFCDSDRPTLTLTTASLSSLQLINGAAVYSESFPATSSIVLSLERGSYGDLVVQENEATVRLSNGSHLNLRGTASTADITVENGSQLGAQDFKVQNEKVDVRNGSYAEVHATELLEVTAQDGSQVRYSGNPQIKETNDISSNISSLR